MPAVIEFLSDLSYWAWLIGGLILLSMEIILPGVAFLWIGAAAIITGVAVFIVPAMDWHWQVAIFAILSVLTLILFRRHLGRRPIATDQPGLNRRGAQFIGQRYVLSDPIEAGRGRVRIGDGWWRVRGPDLPANSQVEVVAIDGATLQVVAVAGAEGGDADADGSA